ncbi:MAG: glycosyltransferase family 2 protein [Saprospiraceae bacterium]
MKFLVSILIPTYNQSEYLLKGVVSALNQDYSNLEIIIGDDSDDEKTKAIILPLLSDKRLKYHKNEIRLGRLENYRNLLLNQAKGSYVLMMDGDDYLFVDNYISQAVKFIESNDSISYVFSRHCIDNPSNSTLPHFKLLSGKSLLESPYYFLSRFSHLTTLYDRAKAIEADIYKINDVLGFLSLLNEGNIGYNNNFVGVWRKTSINESFNFNTNKAFSDMHMIDNAVYRYNIRLSKWVILKYKMYYVFTYILLAKMNNYKFTTQEILDLKGESISKSKFLKFYIFLINNIPIFIIKLLNKLIATINFQYERIFNL